MWYRKNLYAWEQWSRVILGAAMVAGGIFWLGGLWGWAIAAGGFALGLTGIFGYCPACAMVGREPIDKS